MGILNIRKAERAGSKLVIGIAGQSGSGKTLTALYIARGMVDSAEQIGFLDTENRRGSLYADELDGQFMIGDLFYPFTPERYAQAIKEFQDAGVKVLVIDSVSHEWESGCMEIAESPLLNGKKMADWKKAKAEHKKFMTVLLQSDMHIICCIRAAEKTDFTNPREPKSRGVQPLCEKNFMFEMTASVMMYNEGSLQMHTKVPTKLKKAFGPNSHTDNQGVTWNNGYLGRETGEQIRVWAEGAGFDEQLNSWQNRMQLAANDGSDALMTAWKAMPDDMQKKLDPMKRQMWASAKAVDKMADEAKKEPDSTSIAESVTSKGDFSPVNVAQREKIKKSDAPEKEQPAQKFETPEPSNETDDDFDPENF